MILFIDDLHIVYKTLEMNSAYISNARQYLPSL